MIQDSDTGDLIPLLEFHIDFFAENYRWSPREVMGIPVLRRIWLYERRQWRIEKARPSSSGGAPKR